MVSTCGRLRRRRVTWLRVGAGGPGQEKLGPTDQQQEQTGSGHLVDEEREPLHRRGIRPVEVFDDHAQRLSLGFCEQPPEQRFERLLPLVLGRDGERRIPCRQR
jgi:hypothetical protein